MLMEVPEESVDLFAAALQNPAYDLYLGRKNCIPTDFIYQGTFENEKMLCEELVILRGKKIP